MDRYEPIRATLAEASRSLKLIAKLALSDDISISNALLSVDLPQPIVITILQKTKCYDRCEKIEYLEKISHRLKQLSEEQYFFDAANSDLYLSTEGDLASEIINTVLFIIDRLILNGNTPDQVQTQNRPKAKVVGTVSNYATYTNQISFQRIETNSSVYYGWLSAFFRDAEVTLNPDSEIFLTAAYAILDNPGQLIVDKVENQNIEWISTPDWEVFVPTEDANFIVSGVTINDKFFG